MTMFDKKINKVEKVEGDNIFIFQYIDSAGNPSEERKSFEEFLKPFVKEKDEQIQLLRKSLSSKEKIEDLLDEKVLKLSDKILQLEKEKQQLETQVTHFLTEIEGKDLSETTNLYQDALELFIKGNIEEALAILDDAKLEEIEQKALESIQQAAETRILKAQILRVDHKYQEAGINYEKAIKLHQSWSYYLEAAGYFYFLNNFKKASYYYRESINTASNASQKATSLNDYGNLKRNNNEFQTAEELYNDALEIIRELVEKNPKKHSVSLALTLNNLGVLFKNSNDLVKAEEFIFEALEIYEFLTEEDLQIHLPNVALTMNNLANLQYRRNAFQKAEHTSSGALKIYRNLATINPLKFVPKKAMLISNFAAIKMKVNKIEEAKELLEESLEIIQKLAIDNPKAYMPMMAGVLNNLASIKKNSEELEDAEQKYLKALQIYKELHKNNLPGYFSNIGGLLNNIGLLQERMNKFKEAQEAFEDALEIGIQLVKDNPNVYTPDLAMTKLNFGHFYQKSIVNKEESIKLVDGAVTDLLPFMEIPYIQNYLQKAFLILELWNINIEEYWQKKMSERYDS